MVPRRRNAMTTQTARGSRKHVLLLRWALVGGPITALAAALPRRKITIFGRRAPGPWGGRKEGPQGRNRSVNPFALHRCGTKTEPLLLKGMTNIG